MLVRLRPRPFGGVDRRAGRGRSRSRPRPCCGRSARAPERRSARAAGRRAGRAARSRDRSRSRAPAPRAAGPCPSRSAPGRATSCRGRCGRRCRPSAAPCLDQAVLDPDRLEPVASSSARHCASSRSRPPKSASISRSSHFAPCGSFPGGDDGVEHEQSRVVGRGGADRRAGSAAARLVVPVVEDRREHVDVAGGTRSKKLPATNVDAVAERRLVPRRLRQVEDDPAQTGLAARSSTRSGAVAAADVDDELVASPLERSRAGRPCGSPPSGMARSNAPRSSGCVAEPAPEVGAGTRSKVGSPAGASSSPSARCQTPPNRCAKSSQPRSRRRRSDASVLRKTPGSSSAKTPSLASARRSGGARPASAPTSRRELVDGSRPVGERVRDQVGGDRERPASPSAPRKSSQRSASGRSRSSPARGRDGRGDLVRLGVGERAAVEQRAPVADDRDDGRLVRRAAAAASSSSTAQAKLGSSASGSAPPPTRATVSSTSPPIASASRSARARTASAGSRSIRSTGISSGRSR